MRSADQLGNDCTVYRLAASFPCERSLPLDKMSTEEKPAALEGIWSDLAKYERQVSVPHWHKQVLNQRQRQIDRGEATFIDWEEAKRRIRERTG